MIKATLYGHRMCIDTLFKREKSMLCVYDKNVRILKSYDVDRHHLATLLAKFPPKREIESLFKCIELCRHC